MTNGTPIVPAIVIEGTREDWPGGSRILTPFDPQQEPDTLVTWFGAVLTPDDNEASFRITKEAILRMEEETPGARGNRLVDALLAWLSDNPDHQLESRNHFQVKVCAGDTWVEPYVG